MPMGVIHYAGNTILVKAHFWIECQAEFVAMDAAVHRVIHDVNLYRGEVYSLKVIEKETIMEQNSLYLCATSVILEIVCSCMWASLYCCRNNLCVLYFTFCIHSCKGTYLPESSAYVFICCAVRNCVKRIFCRCSTTTATLFLFQQLYVRCMLAYPFTHTVLHCSHSHLSR